MRPFVVLVMLLGCAGVMSADPLPPPIYTRPKVPSRDALDKLNLKMVWSLVVPVEGRRDGLAMVQHFGNEVIVQTRSGLIASYDAQTGSVRWRTRVGNPYPMIYPIGVNERYVLVLNGTRLYGLLRTNGTRDFVHDLITAPSAGPVADAERVYQVLGVTRLVALNLPQPPEEKEPAPTPPPSKFAPETEKPQQPKPNTNELNPLDLAAPPTTVGNNVLRSAPSVVGAVNVFPSLAVVPSVLPPYQLALGSATPSMAVMPSTLPPYRLDNGSTTPSITVVPTITELSRLNERKPTTQLKPYWLYKSQIRLEDSPLLTSEYLLQPSTENLVVSLAKPNHEVVFEFKADSPVTAPLARAGEVAYVATQQNSVYAVDMIAGRVLWRYTAPGIVRSRPIVTEDNVFLSSDRFGSVCLDRTSGQELWRQPFMTRVLAVGPKCVYGTDRSEALIVAERRRGIRLGGLDSRDFVVPIVNNTNDRLFLGAHNGLLICLRDRDVPEPKLLRTPDPVPPKKGEKEKAKPRKELPGQGPKKDPAPMPEPAPMMKE